MTAESETSTDTATKVDKAAEWLAGHVAYISGLKNPSEAQQLLVLLHNKADKSKEDLKKLNLIVKAERNLEKTKKARAAVMSMISADKNEAAEAARKSRTHALIQLGTLVKLAGLEQFNRAEIFGILLAAFPNTDADVEKIKRAGQSASLILAKREEKSAAEAPAPAPVAASNAPTTPAPAAAAVATPAPAADRLAAAAHSFDPDARRGIKTVPVDLTVPIHEKDDAKTLGARWNAEKRIWFVPAGVDTTPFAKWIC